jgi:ribosomal protein S18 acetylase RimI-like enzyme
MILNSEIELIKAVADDTEVISELAKEIWWEHYPSIIGKNQVEYMLKIMYSLDVIRNHIDRGPQQFFLIRDSNIHVGFIAVEIKENECFIQKFYLRNSSRGNGLAAKCFELLKLVYPQQNILRLQVNRENIRAINFYFKLGFIIEKSANFDIGNGFFMNDFVMVYHKNKNK